MELFDALVTAVMGYGMVFLGIVLLIVVVVIMGKVMVSSQKKTEAAASAAAAAAPASVAAAPKAAPAPGTAGEIKLYGTEPRDAAMIMAIVADKMGKPIYELRFISIKEVK